MIFAVVAAAALGASSALVRLEPDVPVWNAHSSMWSLDGSAPADEVMTLTVALAVSTENIAKLENTFWAVSNPKGLSYRKYLSKSEIKAILAVPDDRVARVQQYFLSHDAISAKASSYNDMITITMPVAGVQRALNTRIGAFSHREQTGRRILRALAGYSLPLALVDDVKMVDLLQFPRVRSASLYTEITTAPMVEAAPVGKGNWPNACTAKQCSGLVTPAVIGERYKVDVNDTTPMAGSMSVAEFQFQYFDDEDLAAFSESCHTSVEVSEVIGGNVQRSGVESELDIEYIRGVSPGINLTVIYSSTYSLLDWANGMLDLDNPPLVHSVSYGNDEAQQTGAAYMETVNTAFMKAGALGLSILFASGDQGVCGREGCGFGDQKRFKPDFPGGSPYHTSVGATDFAGDVVGEEKAWQSGGGGFSDTFPIPDYQKDAVAKYKADLATAGKLPDASLYNDTGRGYPDVAALGGQKAPYCVNVGRWQGVAGTSASCPVVAAIFARLNAQLLAKGQPPLGFLNPFIYAHPEAFQDVTLGKNNDKQTEGFEAIPGWDAATGHGTPDLEALSAIVAAM